MHSKILEHLRRQKIEPNLLPGDGVGELFRYFGEQLRDLAQNTDNTNGLYEHRYAMASHPLEFAVRTAIQNITQYYGLPTIPADFLPPVILADDEAALRLFDSERDKEDWMGESNLTKNAYCIWDGRSGRSLPAGPVILIGIDAVDAAAIIEESTHFVHWFYKNGFGPICVDITDAPRVPDYFRGMATQRQEDKLDLDASDLVTQPGILTVDETTRTGIVLGRWSKYQFIEMASFEEYWAAAILDEAVAYTTRVAFRTDDIQEEPIPVEAYFNSRMGWFAKHHAELLKSFQTGGLGSYLDNLVSALDLYLPISSRQDLLLIDEYGIDEDIVTHALGYELGRACIAQIAQTGPQRFAELVFYEGNPLAQLDALRHYAYPDEKLVETVPQTAAREEPVSKPVEAKVMLDAGWNSFFDLLVDNLESEPSDRDSTLHIDLDMLMSLGELPPSEAIEEIQSVALIELLIRGIETVRAPSLTRTIDEVIGRAQPELPTGFFRSELPAEQKLWLSYPATQRFIKMLADEDREDAEVLDAYANINYPHFGRVIEESMAIAGAGYIDAHFKQIASVIELNEFVKSIPRTLRRLESACSQDPYGTSWEDFFIFIKDIEVSRELLDAVCLEEDFTGDSMLTLSDQNSYRTKFETAELQSLKIMRNYITEWTSSKADDLQRLLENPAQFLAWKNLLNKVLEGGDLTLGDPFFETKRRLEAIFTLALPQAAYEMVENPEFADFEVENMTEALSLLKEGLFK